MATRRKAEDKAESFITEIPSQSWILLVTHEYTPVIKAEITKIRNLNHDVQIKGEAKPAMRDGRPRANLTEINVFLTCEDEVKLNNITNHLNSFFASLS